jgi:glycosyltransferase involved in cell wall biosynthesis
MITGQKQTLANPSVIVSANSLWNIANFRSGLIKAIAAEGFRPVIAAPFEPGKALPLSQEAELVPLGMDRSGINPFADGSLVARYLNLFRTLRPSAYLSFTIKPNIYGAFAAGLAGIPAIPNVSGLGTAFLQGGALGRLVDMLYRLAFAKCRVVFFQNPDDRALFIDRRIVSESQARLLAGSGVDLKKFTPARPPGIRPPTFLFIGRLLTDKGVREFVEAAQGTKARFPGARFQLLGGLDPGNRSAIGKDELDRWVAEHAIEYLGPTHDVRPHIAEASAVVLPSYREGLPRSLLEGGAMARPLIATDVPGCREIVKDGVTGLLCQVRSASSLAGAMARFIEMGVDQRQALGDAARAKVVSEYDERAVIDAYLEVLKPLRRSREP